MFPPIDAAIAAERHEDLTNQTSSMTTSPTKPYKPFHPRVYAIGPINLPNANNNPITTLNTSSPLLTPTHSREPTPNPLLLAGNNHASSSLESLDRNLHYGLPQQQQRGRSDSTRSDLSDQFSLHPHHLFAQHGLQNNSNNQLRQSNQQLLQSFQKPEKQESDPQIASLQQQIDRIVNTQMVVRQQQGEHPPRPSQPQMNIRMQYYHLATPSQSRSNLNNPPPFMPVMQPPQPINHAQNTFMPPQSISHQLPPLPSNFAPGQPILNLQPQPLPAGLVSSAPFLPPPPPSNAASLPRIRRIFYVDHDCVGIIIGTGGQEIHNLQNLFSVSVEINRKIHRNKPPAMYRVNGSIQRVRRCVIEGSLWDVERAFARVHHVLTMRGLADRIGAFVDYWAV